MISTSRADWLCTIFGVQGPGEWFLFGFLSWRCSTNNYMALSENGGVPIDGYGIYTYIYIQNVAVLSADSPGDLGVPGCPIFRQNHIYISFQIHTHSTSLFWKYYISGWNPPLLVTDCRTMSPSFGSIQLRRWTMDWDRGAHAASLHCQKIQKHFGIRTSIACLRIGMDGKHRHLRGWKSPLGVPTAMG